MQLKALCESRHTALFLLTANVAQTRTQFHRDTIVIREYGVMEPENISAN